MKSVKKTSFSILSFIVLVFGAGAVFLPGNKWPFFVSGVCMILAQLIWSQQLLTKVEGEVGEIKGNVRSIKKVVDKDTSTIERKIEKKIDKIRRR